MTKDKKVPTYKFEEKDESIAPTLRKISKTMEVTETFDMMSVLSYLAKMDKAIEDKKSELDGLIAMKKAYEEEVSIIEKQLGVMKADEEFKKKEAKENEKKQDEKQKELEASIKEKLLESGNFVEKNA